MCSNALPKNTVITLLNPHRSYTEKNKFKKFFIIVMESALWIFGGSSFHNLAAEVPKRRFPNRMDLFIYGTSDVNAVERIRHVNVEHVTKVFRGTTIQRFES